MSAHHSSGIGASVRRREDARFLTGRGRYVADLAMSHQAHACFLRSPQAHAKIVSIDTRAARAAEGVIAVYTGQDLLEGNVGSLPSGWNVRQRDGSPMAEPPHYPLAVDRVRHVGDPVAVVIAETVEAAKDATELVEVEYESLPAVTDAISAAADGAPVVWPQARNNVCTDWEIGDATAVEAAFRNAVHTVSLQLVNNRLIQNPIEPRAAIAHFERTTGQHTLYTTSQNPHTVRSTIAAFVLRVPEHFLRVVSPDVGGGFGAKIPVYPEEATLSWAASRIDRPVKWVAERAESFVTDAQGRDHVTQASLALDGEGRFLALRVVTHANVGAYLYGGSAAIPTHYYAPLLSGVYRIAAIHANVKLVFTNTVTVDAYRGAGRPEATYVLERLVDLAARSLKIDRIEIRRRNFIPREAFPYQTPLGIEYDTGDHEATLARALELADWGGFAGRRAASKAAGKLRGIGISTYVEIAGGVPSRVLGQIGGRGGRSESALVRVHPSGGVTIFSGSHSHGQGHETAFAQIVCDRLNLPFEMVRIVQGDTDLVPYGRGTAASRSLVLGGSAIVRAIERVIEKGCRIAGQLLEAAETDVVFENARFRIAGSDRSISFSDVARAAYSGHGFASDAVEHGLEASAFYDPVNWTFPGGCHVCELEVDPETGTVRIDRIVAVDDVGTVINPMIVEGQIHGGLAQGIGQALLEKACYDEAGQLLSGSFMDYCMPRADDLPVFAVDTCTTPCLHNPLNAKGCAEVGSVGIPPAIVNAAIDALGVEHLDMPLTPETVWRALRKNQSP